MAEILKSWGFSFCIFSLAAGIISNFIPLEFKKAASVILELMLFLILISSFKHLGRSFSVSDIIIENYAASASYDDIKEKYIKRELTDVIKENLEKEGIFPDDIRIDISIENEELRISGCYLSMEENDGERFKRKKEKLENELQMPFYLVKKEDE